MIEQRAVELGTKRTHDFADWFLDTFGTVPLDMNLIVSMARELRRQRDERRSTVAGHTCGSCGYVMPHTQGCLAREDALATFLREALVRGVQTGAKCQTVFDPETNAVAMFTKVDRDQCDTLTALAQSFLAGGDQCSAALRAAYEYQKDGFKVVDAMVERKPMLDPTMTHEDTWMRYVAGNEVTITLRLIKGKDAK